MKLAGGSTFSARTSAARSGELFETETETETEKSTRHDTASSKPERRDPERSSARREACTEGGEERPPACARGKGGGPKAGPERAS